MQTFKHSEVSTHPCTAGTIGVGNFLECTAGLKLHHHEMLENFMSNVLTPMPSTSAEKRLTYFIHASESTSTRAGVRGSKSWDSRVLKFYSAGCKGTLSTLVARHLKSSELK